MFSEINSENHDCPETKSPVHSYIIASTPRSGSSLLSAMLWDTGIAGVPHEYFHDKHSLDFIKRWDVKTMSQYFSLLLRNRSTPNGVFGAKLHLHQMANFPLGYKDLVDYLHSPKYIYIQRKNKLLQAVSFVRAFKTKQWEVKEGESVKSVEYDFTMLDKAYKKLNDAEEKWEQYFSEFGISPFRIVYEEFVNSKENTIREVLCYLGQDPDSVEIAPPSMRKMADSLSEEWVSRYLDDCRIKEKST